MKIQIYLLTNTTAKFRGKKLYSVIAYNHEFWYSKSSGREFPELEPSTIMEKSWMEVADYYIKHQNCTWDDSDCVDIIEDDNVGESAASMAERMLNN